jgi:DNA topoisomerase IA
MADQIVITEKSSQAKDVRAAVGSRYGEILAAEGHLFDLLEPEDVVPAWKRWSPILLRPEGLYGTRAATVILGQGARRVIGVGRVKTPTLAIVCKRESEIRNFVPIAYFEIVATAKVAGGQFQMRHGPQDRIVRRETAQDVVNAAQGFEGAPAVRVEDKRQGPPKLHDLPSLQKLCGSRFGWL